MLLNVMEFQHIITAEDKIDTFCSFVAYIPPHSFYYPMIFLGFMGIKLADVHVRCSSHIAYDAIVAYGQLVAIASETAQVRQ